MAWFSDIKGTQHNNRYILPP